MSELLIQTNDLIQISTTGEKPRTYRSRVEDVRAESILVAWPTAEGVRASIRQGQTLLISFRHEGLIYGFEAIVEKLSTSPLAMITLQASGPPAMIDRRENVRVRESVLVELSPKVISIDCYRDSREEESRIRSHTTTLSAGGFTILHDSVIPAGLQFDVRMTLPGKSKPLAFTAKVVRCEPSSEKSARRLYDIALVCSRIGESARASIVRFVFRSQARELRSLMDDSKPDP